MVANATGRTGRTIFRSVILEISQIFLFLRVYRNHRRSLLHGLLFLTPDKLKLLVPVRNRFSDLFHFPVLLTVVAKLFHNALRRALFNENPLFRQFLCDIVIQLKNIYQ